MKYIKLSILLFIPFLINGQVTKEYFAAYGDISGTTNVTADTFNFTITGFAGNSRPYGNSAYARSDVQIGDRIVSTNCNHYIIKSITTVSPSLTGTMYKADGLTPNPNNFQRVAILREQVNSSGFKTVALPPSGDGNSGAISGISIDLAACIKGHYEKINQVVGTYANISDYGAIGNGVFDNASAISTAFATGKPVLIPNGIFMTSVIKVPRGAKILGISDSSVLKLNTGTILKLSNNCTVENIKFDGVNNTTGTNVGIELNGGSTQDTCYLNTIRNCTFVNFSKAGIYNVNTVRSNTSVATHYGNTIISAKFINNEKGLFCDDSGEYMNTIGCEYFNNTIGLHVIGGNFQLTGGKMAENVTGALIRNGSNDSHGHFVGLLSNHNGVNLDVSSIANGFNFTGCSFFAGNIYLTSAPFLGFSNCQFGSTTIYETGCTNSTISNSTLYTSVTINRDAIKIINCETNGSAAVGALPTVAGNYNLTVDAFGNYSYSVAGSGGSTWGLTGNAGTVQSTNFIGTTDAIGLSFRTNNAIRQTILPNGFTGFNDISPITMVTIDAAKGGSGNPLYLKGLIQGATTDSLINSANGILRRVTATEVINNAPNVSTIYDWVINGINIGKGNGSIFSNTRLGVNSLSVATGGSNTVGGWSAGASNTTGTDNSYWGVQAGQNGTSATFNSAFGGSALRFNITGVRNAAFGQRSLIAATNNDNTAIGNNSGENTSTGSGNFFGGSGAGSTNTTGSNLIMIGKDANAPTTTTSNALNIGSWITGANGIISIPNASQGAATDSIVTRSPIGQLNRRSVSEVVGFDVNTQLTPANAATATIDYASKNAVYQSISAPATMTLAYSNALKGGVHHIVITPSGASSTVTFTNFIENGATVTTKTFTGYTILTVKQLTSTSAEIVNIYRPTSSTVSKGTATLSNGTVTVSEPSVSTGSVITLTYRTPSGATGILSAPLANRTTGVGFVINSLQAGLLTVLTTDNSTVDWVITN